MSAQNHIRYITRKEINDTRWNECIGEANNGLVYAYSFYLDAMADDWEALVLNDYEAVLPLTCRKKWGIHYLYQPPFCAQLGVFGNQLSEELVEQFLSTIPKKFRYWDFYGNRKNLFSSNAFPFFQRVNYVLDLNATFAALEKQYRENIRRNIKKAKQYGCRLQTDVLFDDIIQLAKAQPQQTETPDDAFERFKELFQLLQQKGAAKTYGVLSAQGQLIASAAFLFSHNRAYYILVGNHPNGRTLGASHALIDAFIQDHAGQKLVLDFEGSDIRNLAFFYSSFGATAEQYPAFKINRLPFWMKWLKK